VVRLIKEIGLPFVARTLAGTVGHQGEGRLHVFSPDTTRAATTAITAAGSALLILLPLLVEMVGADAPPDTS
jgi:hypothetical protein